MGRKRKAASKNEECVQDASCRRNDNIFQERIALYIRYGQLSNRYHWYVRWAVTFGFHRQLTDYFKCKLDEVIANLNGIKYAIRNSIMHRNVVAIANDSHAIVKAFIDEYRDFSHPDEMNIYDSIIECVWGNEKNELSDDAREAGSLINATLIILLSRLECNINALSNVLIGLPVNANKLAYYPFACPVDGAMIKDVNIRLWNAFYNGMRIDHMANPAYQCGRDCIRYAFKRIYFLKSLCGINSEKGKLCCVNGSESGQSPISIKWPPNELVTLPELPNDDGDIHVEYVKNFIRALRDRYKLQNDGPSLRAMPALDNQLIARQDVAQGLELQDKWLDTKKRVIRKCLLEILYHYGFIPDNADLEKLRALVIRLHLDLVIPDMTIMCHYLRVPRPYVIETTIEQDVIEAIFDALIAREAIMYADDSYDVVKGDGESIGLKMPPGPEEMGEYASYSERSRFLDSIVNDTCERMTIDLIRNDHLVWLKGCGEAPSSVIKAFEEYVAVQHPEYDINMNASIAVDNMVKNGMCKETENIINNKIRYINKARSLIRTHFGEHNSGRSIVNLSGQGLSDQSHHLSSSSD